MLQLIGADGDQVSWCGVCGDWRPEESHQNEKQQFRADVKYLSRMLKSPLKPIDPFKLGGTGLSFTLRNN